MSTTVVILFLLFAFSLSLVFAAIGRSRRRTFSRESGTGRFSPAKCANPTHGAMKSRTVIMPSCGRSDHLFSEQCEVTPQESRRSAWIVLELKRTF